MEGRIRIVGLCLIVAFVLSAVIAAGAQASTEIVSSPVCVKVPKPFKGHYLDKRCTVEAGPEGGKYELEPGPSWKAKGKSIKRAPVAAFVSAQAEIHCTKSTGSGEVLGPTRVQARFRFYGCNNVRSAKRPLASCGTNPNAEDLKGEIETRKLLGVIGENGANQVVVSFTGESGSTEPDPAETFAVIECENEEVFTLHGTLSGTWTQAPNQASKKGGISFVADAAGEQALLQQFVNPLSHEPEEQSVTLEATQAFTFGDKYEMRQG